MSTTRDLVLAWEILSVLIFTAGSSLLDDKSSTKCTCGREFSASLDRVEKFLRPITKYLESGKPKNLGEKVRVGLAVCLALQLLPLFFTVDLFWRLRKFLHGKHCLPHQLNRTEIK